MRFNEYSHRRGKELCRDLHRDVFQEVRSILAVLEPCSRGTEEDGSVDDHIAWEFVERGWLKEGEEDFRAFKTDSPDLRKRKVAIEMEFSRFEMFFGDFLRFMLLYERREIDVGIIITLDQMAYERWGGGPGLYTSARASFQRLADFLQGDYSSIVRVPIWCIGIE